MKSTEKNWAIKVSKEGNKMGIHLNKDAFDAWEMTDLIANTFMDLGKILMKHGLESLVYDLSKQTMEAAKEKMEEDEEKPDIAIEVAKLDDPADLLNALKELFKDGK